MADEGKCQRISIGGIQHCEISGTWVRASEMEAWIKKCNRYKIALDKVNTIVDQDLRFAVIGREIYDITDKALREQPKAESEAK